MRSGDVDTGEFSSWPLLRPDELATLPSEVLKASLAELDFLCDRSPGEDAISNYALRQRERTASILSERAAQVRVRALLTAGTSASLSMAPSHGLPPKDGGSRHDRCTSPEHGADLTSGATTYFSHGSEGECIPSVLSPPRARVGHSHQAGPVAGTPTGTTPETFATAQGGETGDELDASSHQGDAQMRDNDNITPQGCAPKSSKDRLYKPDWPAGGGSSDANDAMHTSDKGTGRQDTSMSRKDRGQPSFTSVVHEKWGSVFVVGGGQRRRRASGRRRSVEAEDTPATRRAHVDKERQERRKASLCRLLARKEQRALQQETRRKRRAAAARAAAVAAASAASSEVAAEAAGVTSSSITTPTTTTTPTPSTTLTPARGTTSLPAIDLLRSPTNAVNALEGNLVANGSVPIPAPAPASQPSRVVSSDARGREREVSAQGWNATESPGNKEVVMCDDIDVLSRGGGEQPCGTVVPEGDADVVSENCGGLVGSSSGKGGPRAIAIRDSSSSSSQSESVSGGDSSDDDDFSVDEDEKQKDGRVAQVTHNQPFERATKSYSTKFGVLGGGGDAEGVAEDERAALLEGNEDLSPLRQAEQGNCVGVARVESAQSASEMCGDFTPAIPSGPLKYCHENDAAGWSQDHRSAADRVRDDDKSQQMATTTAVLPPTGNSTTVGNESDEGSGTDTHSDMEWENGSASAGGHSIDGSLDLPGPLDVGHLRTGLADGTPDNGSSPSGFGQPQTLAAQFQLRSGDIKQRRNSSRSVRKASSPRQPVPQLSRGVNGATLLALDRASATVEAAAVGDTGRGSAEAKVAPQRSSPQTSRASATAPLAPCLSEEDRSDVKVSCPSVASALEGDLSASPSHGEGDGCSARGESPFVSPKPTASSLHQDEAQHQQQRLTTVNEAPATNVKISLDERILRRTSNALRDSTLHSGQIVSETDNLFAPGPKAVLTGGTRGGLESATLQRTAGGQVASQVRHRNKPLSSMPRTCGGTVGDAVEGCGDTPSSVGGYTECFPKLGAILSAYHNGRALTRETDCRSLPLTSSIMARGRGGKSVSTGLTATEEEACLQLQLKLYAIYVRVIKDYAAVFSLGDDWPTSGAEDPSSLVYSGDPSALHYRVNSKARPEVYNIVTDVLNNRCEQWEELPTGLGLKTTWNLLWTWSKPHIQYSSLLMWQKVNHFPNSRELTRKDLLNKHISRFMAPGGRLAKEFHIMPQTFVLPHQFTAFVAAFTSTGQCGRDRGKSRGEHENPACVGVDSFGDVRDETGVGAEAGPMSGVGRGDNVWIMKPVGMSRGRGIRLIDDIKNISYADKVVLQKYIGTPLLLDGYKFDLRLYVLVTSFNPLEAFIYKEGFARLSTHLYEKGDIGNPFIHLTNSSVQRLNESGATRDNPLHHANVSEAGGTKTTLSYLWRRLAASGVDVRALWGGICAVVVKSLVCVEGAIPKQPNSFELFGYDVLIDDKLRPWLIEVNASPSMARDSHIDRQVKETLIFDTIHLVDPLPFDRKKLADVLEKRLSAIDNSKAWSSKERRASESFDGRNSSAPPFEGDKEKEKGARASLHGSRPRRRKDEVELDRDLNDILGGRRPRKVGELPARMGNFIRLCPGTAAHRHALRLRRRVIRPQPGDDSFDANR